MARQMNQGNQGGEGVGQTADQANQANPADNGYQADGESDMEVEAGAGGAQEGGVQHQQQQQKRQKHQRKQASVGPSSRPQRERKRPAHLGAAPNGDKKRRVSRKERTAQANQRLTHQFKDKTLPLHQALSSYSGKVALHLNAATRELFAVVGYNLTFEKVDSFLNDNVFTKHFWERHQELTDLAEGVKSVFTLKSTKKCPLCNEKIEEKAPETDDSKKKKKESSKAENSNQASTSKASTSKAPKEPAPKTPKKAPEEPLPPPPADTSDSGTENEAELVAKVNGGRTTTLADGTQLTHLPYKAGLRDYAVTSDTSDCAFACPQGRPFNYWDDELNLPVEGGLLFPVLWKPLFLPVDPLAGTVDWDQAMDATSLRQDVPQDIRARVDRMLGEVARAKGSSKDRAEALGKYRYRPSADYCLLGDYEAAIEAVIKKCKEPPVVPSLKEPAVWRKRQQLKRKLQVKRCQKVMEKFMAAGGVVIGRLAQKSSVSSENARPEVNSTSTSGASTSAASTSAASTSTSISAPSTDKESVNENDPNLGYKYFKTTPTGWADSKKMVRDLAKYRSFLIDGEVLKVEFGFNYKDIEIEFKPNMSENELTKLGKTFDLESEGTHIRQYFHDYLKHCKDCRKDTKLSVTSEKKKLISLKKAIKDICKKVGEKEQPACGTEMHFASNFPMPRHKSSSLYKVLAKLPPLLALNNPSADGLLWLLGPVDGLNSVQVYVKCPGQYTAAHQENGLAPSVNVNIGLGICIWLCVDEQDQGPLDKALRSLNLTRNTPFMLTLELIQERGIKAYFIVQHPGQMVIISPGTWHQVLSVGYTANIAWNVAPFSLDTILGLIRSVRQNVLHQMASVVAVIPMLLHLARHYLNDGVDDLLVDGLTPGGGGRKLNAMQTRISREMAGVIYLFLGEHLQADLKVLAKYSGTHHYYKNHLSSVKHYSDRMMMCSECKYHFWNTRLYFTGFEDRLCYPCAKAMCQADFAPEANGAILEYNFCPGLLKRLVNVYFKLATGASALLTMEDGSVKMRNIMSSFEPSRDRKKQYRADVRKIMKKLLNPSGLFLPAAEPEVEEEEEEQEAGKLAKAIGRLQKWYAKQGWECKSRKWECFEYSKSAYKGPSEAHLATAEQIGDEQLAWQWKELIRQAQDDFKREVGEEAKAEEMEVEYDEEDSFDMDDYDSDNDSDEDDWALSDTDVEDDRIELPPIAEIPQDPLQIATVENSAAAAASKRRVGRPSAPSTPEKITANLTTTLNKLKSTVNTVKSGSAVERAILPAQIRNALESAANCALDHLANTSNN